MKTLFDQAALEESLSRIEQLSPETQAQWGKMNVAQMLNHCSSTMEVARGQRHIKRLFIGYILGGMIKKHFYNDAPVKKNSPTHPTFVVVDNKEFEKEKNILIDHLKAFTAGGAEACTSSPHAFFGKLTKEQWGMGMYKHLDHHLKQFGV